MTIIIDYYKSQITIHKSLLPNTFINLQFQTKNIKKWVNY
jgi:hypothetical protein